MPSGTPSRKGTPAPSRKGAPAPSRKGAPAPSRKGTPAPARTGRTRARTARAAAASLLGEEFLAGVATSGYQIEGGFNGEGEPHNNWAGWEATGRVERSGLACDFWRHPDEALDRAAAMGCNAFRLSVEWARLEPRPGELRRRARSSATPRSSPCARRGAWSPIVTLHHFTHPWWLGEEFWLRPGSPDVFARHVERVRPGPGAVLPALGDDQRAQHRDADGLGRGRRPARAAHGASPTPTACSTTCSPRTYWPPTPSPRSSPRPRSPSTRARRRSTSTTACWSTCCSCARRASTPPTSTATSTSAGRCTTPRSRRATPVRRRCAGSSPRCRPTAPSTSRAGGAPGPACAPCTRRQAPRRVVDRRARPRRAPAASMRSASTGTTRWPATPCGCPVVAPRAGGRDWSFGRALWDVAPHPARAWRPGAPPRRPCARACRCGWSRTGWPLGCATGGRCRARTGWAARATCASTSGAVADAVAAGVPVRAYLHWSLVDNYEWGTYEPRFGLFGLDRSDPAAVRWIDTDANGDDAAGEFARVLAGLRAGRPLGPRPSLLNLGGSVAAALRGVRRRGQTGRRVDGSDGSDGPSNSRRSVRRCRTTSTTMTTTIRPSTTSDAIPLTFSTRWPTK